MTPSRTCKDHRLVALRPTSLSDYTVHTFVAGWATLKAETRLYCATYGYSHIAIFRVRDGALCDHRILPGYPDRGWSEDKLKAVAKAEFIRIQRRRSNVSHPIHLVASPTKGELASDALRHWKINGIASQFLGIDVRLLGRWAKNSANFIEGYHYRKVERVKGTKWKDFEYHIPRVTHYAQQKFRKVA